jgi:hypothetical protein
LLTLLGQKLEYERRSFQVDRGEYQKATEEHDRSFPTGWRTLFRGNIPVEVAQKRGRLLSDQRVFKSRMDAQEGKIKEVEERIRKTQAEIASNEEKLKELEQGGE